MTLATPDSTTPQITPEQLHAITHSQCWAQPYPAPILKAHFKKSTSDFQVDELLQIELSGAGEHLWLLIKKTGMNTNFVAEQLAKWAKIPSRDVGYSGLKDRQAVTSQWFSLRIPKSELPSIPFEAFVATNLANDNESLQVIEQKWHNKKLNRGTHKANSFRIRLTDIELNTNINTDINTNTDTNDTIPNSRLQQTSQVDKVLTYIKQARVPNYFGEQRFGRQGNNITTALEWFEQGTIHGRKPHPKKSRDLQSILLSSARSAIFNQILSVRVEQGNWDTGLDGEVFNLNGSGSVFATEQLDEEIKQRLASGDIHPTGPLWGIKNDKVVGDAKALENTVVLNHPILHRLAQGLEEKQIKTMRRPLRLPISDLEWYWESPQTATDDNLPAQALVLQFSLPTGSFATSVLANLVADLSQ